MTLDNNYDPKNETNNELLQESTHYHRFADLQPQYQKTEFENLVRNIRANGLVDPITLYQNTILDGRHRYRACLEAGVPPQFVEFVGDDDAALRLVQSRETRRRPSKDQMAIVGAQAWRMYFEPQARARQAQGVAADLAPNPVQGQGKRLPTAVRQAAAFSGASVERTQQADRVIRDSATLAPFHEDAGKLWECVRDNRHPNSTDDAPLPFSLADAEDIIRKLATNYVVDTEIERAATKAADLQAREQKKEQAQTQERLKQQHEIERQAEAPREAATERAESEIQELQERTVKDLQKTENEKEWADIAVQAVEAERSILAATDAQLLEFDAQADVKKAAISAKNEAEDIAAGELKRERQNAEKLWQLWNDEIQEVGVRTVRASDIARKNPSVLDAPHPQLCGSVRSVMLADVQRNIEQLQKLATELSSIFA